MTRFHAHCAMRWADMDAYGHINNTAYLAYLEQARVSMFFDRYDASFEGGTVVAHHEITYLKPVVYHPQPLRIEMWVEQVRAASFRVQYEIFDHTVLAAHASTALVTFDFATNHPRRLSAEERAVLLSYADVPGAKPLVPTVATVPTGATGATDAADRGVSSNSWAPPADQNASGQVRR